MYSASRLFDRDMVVAYATERGLSVQAPPAPPDAVTRGSVSVIRDRYDWGDVLYAEDVTDDLGATWIEDGMELALPEWVAEVRALLDRPECLGFHEGDHICDGGLNPDTGKLEQPCRWREVCKGVQRTVSDPAGVDRYLSEHTDDQLWALVDKPKTAKERKPRSDDVARTREENLVASDALAVLFFERACEIGHWPIARMRYRAILGEYFMVRYDSGNPLRQHRYVIFRRRPMSWTGELRKDPGTEQSLCEIGLHVRDPFITVQIWTDAGGIVREFATGLRVVDASRTEGSAGSSGSVGMTTIRDISEATVDDAATALVAVTESGLLNSYGIGATDPEKKGAGIGRFSTGRWFKDDARYREKRKLYVDTLQKLEIAHKERGG